MSTNDSTRLPEPQQKQRFYSAWAAAEIAGVSAPTVRRSIPADAEMISGRGKTYGLYTETTLLAYRAANGTQGGVA